MVRLHEDFWTGVRDAVPLQLGLIPYGVIAGVAAVQVGLTPLEAMSLSALVFAGASQLAALDLLADNAPLVIVVLTGAVVNARIMMYSASLAPYFKEYRLRWRALLSSVLVGMSYARSIAEFQDDDPPHYGWYYLGVSLSLYVVWLVTTAGGVLVGANVPEGLDLQFVVPLVFLAMTMSAINDRSTLAAAVAGGAIATAVAWLPMRLNLIVAGVLGIVVGVAVHKLLAAREGESP